MVLLAAFFAEDKYLTEVANLCFIVAILMLCVLPIGLVIAGLKASQKSNKKEFQYFICHHKQGAGAKARLLKIRVKSTAGVKRKVFIDSDDLKDLTKLQDCVANDTESVVLLHSAGVLYRPWCVLEVATAKNMRLQLCRVDFPEVQQIAKRPLTRMTLMCRMSPCLQNTDLIWTMSKEPCVGAWPSTAFGSVVT